MYLYNLLENNKKELEKRFASSADYYFKEMEINNFKCGIAMFEDLISIKDVQELFIKPISQLNNRTQEELIEYIIYKSGILVSTEYITDFDTVIQSLSAGFAIIFFDGCIQAIAVPSQNIPSRGIDKPTNEKNLRTSKESFSDMARKNMSLIRRRIRSSDLKMESIYIGQKTKTEVIMCYCKDFCPQKLYIDVKERLTNADISMLLDSGYLAPFVDKTKYSLFSAVSYTEKADTLCAKICEGKIGIIVDGTPYALIYPYFFPENFNSNEDYTQRPYFASTIRIIRYISFIISVALPGVYIAFTSYAPQALNNKLLFNIYYSQNLTPLPQFAEVILINILLEAIKEAGLRIPESIGNSVSLVAALIIGESAVKAGIVGNVALIVCALSTVTSFIIPTFYEEIFFIRLIFIVLAGILGIPGLSLATLFLFINISNIDYNGYNMEDIYNIKAIVNDGIFVNSFRKNNGKFNLKNAKRE